MLWNQLHCLLRSWRREGGGGARMSMTCLVVYCKVLNWAMLKVNVRVMT